MEMLNHRQLCKDSGSPESHHVHPQEEWGGAWKGAVDLGGKTGCNAQP